MHSQTSFTDRQTNLYCFDNDLDVDANTCTSPTVEVDPLSSPIPTSSSVNLNSSFIDFVIANLSADEINRTDSTTNQRDELPSDLEMAIRRLTTEELESIVQNQLQEIINRNCKAALLNNQIDTTNELMQKYKERINVLQKHVKDLSNFVQTCMKNATEAKSNLVKLTRNVGLQVGESSFLYEEQEKMEVSLADVSTDEANRSTSTTPVDSKSPVNAPKVRIGSSSPSLKDNQESLIIPHMVKLSTFTYEKQPKAIPSDYTQSFSEEIDLTLSDCETDHLLDVPSPQQLDELEEVTELPVKRLIAPGQSTCGGFISPTGSTGSSPTETDNVATVQVEDTKKNKTTPSECNMRINSTEPTCPVKCIDQPPLNGISSSTDSFRSVGHVKPSVNSLVTPLSSQSYLSSESIQPSEFIRPTGQVPSFKPTIVLADSIPSTAAASASNSATTAPSRFDPPIQPLCSQLPCVHPSNNFTNHKEDPQFTAINLTNRKRRLPCSIDRLDPSTIASVEKHHKMIKKHWYDTQLVRGSIPSPTTNSVIINNETSKPPLDSTKTSAQQQSKEPIPFSINPRLFSKEILQDDKKVDEPQVNNNNMYHDWKIPCPNDAVKPDCSVRLPLKFKSYQPATNMFSHQFKVIPQTKFKPFQRIPSFPQTVFPNPAQTPSTSSSIPRLTNSVCCNKEESHQFDSHVPVIQKNDNPLPAVQPLSYKRMPGNPSALETMLNQPFDNNFTRQPVFNWNRPVANQPFIRLEKVKEGILVVWTIPNLSSNRLEQAIYYDVFSRLESSAEQWKRIALIRALPLPMTCTFTKFIRGNCYSFRIRAILRNSIDGTTYEGPFSEPTCLRFS